VLGRQRPMAGNCRRRRRHRRHRWPHLCPVGFIDRARKSFLPLCDTHLQDEPLGGRPGEGGEGGRNTVRSGKVVVLAGKNGGEGLSRGGEGIRAKRSLAPCSAALLYNIYIYISTHFTYSTSHHSSVSLPLQTNRRPPYIHTHTHPQATARTCAGPCPSAAGQTKDYSIGPPPPPSSHFIS